MKLRVFAQATASHKLRCAACEWHGRLTETFIDAHGYARCPKCRAAIADDITIASSINAERARKGPETE